MPGGRISDCWPGMIGFWSAVFVDDGVAGTSGVTGSTGTGVTCGGEAGVVLFVKACLLICRGNDAYLGTMLSFAFRTPMCAASAPTTSEATNATENHGAIMKYLLRV